MRRYVILVPDTMVLTANPGPLEIEIDAPGSHPPGKGDDIGIVARSMPIVSLSRATSRLTGPRGLIVSPPSRTPPRPSRGRRRSARSDRCYGNRSQRGGARG